MTAKTRATRASVATRIPAPVLAALLVGLGCGRTGLDAPVEVTGTAGRVGGAGTAGQGGAAGTAGQGAVGGQATAGTTGGMPGTCVEGTKACTDATTGEVCRGGFFETF